jgi:hypothetical protein
MGNRFMKSTSSEEHRKKPKAQKVKKASNKGIKPRAGSRNNGAVPGIHFLREGILTESLR